MIVFSIAAGSRPDVRAMPGEDVELVRDLSGVRSEQIAGVCVLGDQTQSLALAASPDQDSAGGAAGPARGEQIVSARR